jgi:hypothetical protein
VSDCRLSGRVSRAIDHAIQLSVSLIAETVYAYSVGIRSSSLMVHGQRRAGLPPEHVMTSPSATLIWETTYKMCWAPHWAARRVCSTSLDVSVTFSPGYGCP